MSPVDSPQSISQIELIFGQSVQINQDQNWIYRNHFIFTVQINQDQNWVYRNHFIFTGLMMRLMDEMLWKWDFRKLNELTNIAEGSLKCGDLRKHSKTHSGKKSSKSSGRFSYVAIWGNTHMKTYMKHIWKHAVERSPANLEEGSAVPLALARMDEMPWKCDFCNLTSFSSIWISNNKSDF